MSALLIAGLVQGSVLALLAMVVVLVHQTTGVLNVALGALGMLAAYSWTSLLGFGPSWVGFLVVLVGAAAAGAVIGRATLPLRESRQTVKAVASIGAVTALQAIAVLVWGTAARPLPSLVEGVAFRVDGVGITWQQVVTLVVAAAGCAGTLLLFRVGVLGSALRAVAADSRTAQLVGLPVRTLWVVAWTLGTVAAAVGGMLVGARSGVTITGLTFSVLIPLVAALVGRFRDPVRAAVAGVLLGVADAFLAAGAATAPLREALPLVVAVGALLADGRLRTRWERV